MSEHTLLGAAKQLIGYGLSVIGCKGKRPVISSWSPYQKRIPSEEAVTAMFSGKGAEQVAVICGEVSGNLEVIDVDSKNDQKNALADLWERIVDYFDGDPSHLLVTKTVSGGMHIYFRSETALRNRPLAKQLNDGGTQVLIEVRGQGGYVIAPPSKGYEILYGSFDNIPVLDLDTKEDLLAICSSYNEVFEEKHHQASSKSANNYKCTPWDAYNADEEEPWEEILAGAGWTKAGSDSERTYWHRPGSENVHGANWHHTKRVFYVHTSSAQHFRQNAAYTPAAILAHVKYGGDFSKSTHHLRRKGYGEKFTEIEKEAIQEASMWFSDEKFTYEDIVRMVQAGFPEVDEDAVEPVVRVAKEKSGKATGIVKFITSFLEKKNLIRNLATKMTEQKEDGMEMKDEDINSLILEAKSANEKISKDLFMIAWNSNAIPSYHPIWDYLNSVRGMQHNNAFVDLINCLKLKNENDNPIKSIVTKWMMQLIGILHGYPAELVLVLIGPQHIYKSTFFKTLLPDCLQKKFFTADRMLPGKDSDQLMTEKWIILDDEWDGQSKRDAEHLKALVSKTQFSHRVPYGRATQNFDRLAVMCGTSNKSDVINDPTGNRRIIPLELKTYDVHTGDNINRDLVFAQMLEVWDLYGPKSIRLDPGERAMLSSLSEGFQKVNYVREMIELYFEPGNEGQFMVASEIAAGIREQSNISFNPAQVGVELKMLGYDQVRKRLGDNKTQSRCYQIRKKSVSVQDMPDMFGSRAYPN